LEDFMIENKPEKAMKPLPVPHEEFEIFPEAVEELFDLIARRPFELLEKRPLLFGRDLELFWKTEPETPCPAFLKLYETEENLVVRAEVPGYTWKELNITCEPWRLIITGKKEYKEEVKSEKKVALHLGSLTQVLANHTLYSRWPTPNPRAPCVPGPLSRALSSSRSRSSSVRPLLCLLSSGCTTSVALASMLK
jgi:HSP20 family molecular chaperone IbpA